MELFERSKSVRVAIYATEPYYGGLHGYFNCGIYHINTFSEADEIGRCLCDELIDSYTTLTDLYEEGEREYDYAIYEIPNAFDDISDDQLDADLYDYGLSGFIKRYSL